MSKAKKTIIICICVVLGLFLIYNIIWAVINTKRYKPYKEEIGYNEAYQDWSCDKDGYMYCVFPSDYLRFNGNLSISQETTYDSQTNTYVEETRKKMLIHINLDGSYTFTVNIGFLVPDKTEYAGYEFILDEKMQPFEEFDPDDQEFYDEHIEDIKDMYAKAKNMWNSLPIEI